jgi:hypothetical protein
MQSITTRGTDNLKTGFSLTVGAFLIIDSNYFNTFCDCECWGKSSGYAIWQSPRWCTRRRNSPLIRIVTIVKTPSVWAQKNSFNTEPASKNLPSVSTLAVI